MGHISIFVRAENTRIRSGYRFNLASLIWLINPAAVQQRLGTMVGNRKRSPLGNDKSASGSLPPLSCLPVRDCRSRHGRVSACSRDTARLSEPMRGQAETEFAQVLRLRDGTAEHRCDASRGEPDS